MKYLTLVYLFLLPIDNTYHVTRYLHKHQTWLKVKARTIDTKNDRLVTQFWYQYKQNLILHYNLFLSFEHRPLSCHFCIVCFLCAYLDALLQMQHFFLIREWWYLGLIGLLVFSSSCWYLVLYFVYEKQKQNKTKTKNKTREGGGFCVRCVKQVAFGNGGIIYGMVSICKWTLNNLGLSRAMKVREGLLGDGLMVFGRLFYERRKIMVMHLVVE